MKVECFFKQLMYTGDKPHSHIYIIKLSFLRDGSLYLAQIY